MDANENRFYREKSHKMRKSLFRILWEKDCTFWSRIGIPALSISALGIAFFIYGAALHHEAALLSGIYMIAFGFVVNTIIGLVAAARAFASAISELWEDMR